MERLTEKNPCWIDDEFWTSACEPDDEEMDAVYRRLKEYEDTGIEPEEVMAQDRWIRIQDSLPDKQQRVIVRCNPGGTVAGWFMGNGWMTDFGNSYNCAVKVTHWMPLPQPPKED